MTQSRADINDFIGVIEAFRRDYGKVPANVYADAGYGSPAKYSYLKKMGICNYVKDQTRESNAFGSRPDCFS